MSAFNILRCQLNCSNCKNLYEGNIQFKYGDTWQLIYKLGDSIKWGGNDIGYFTLKKLKVFGILESDVCPICNQNNIDDEFDILIKENMIMNISKLQSLSDYKNNNSYVILQ